MRKPNLIVFLTDQQRADTISCYGNRKIHAPNLAKLASQSVIFQRAYVTQPLCVPSRASLLTGMWPHTTGCTRNSLALDSRHRTLMELFENGDYCSAYLGKWQLGNEAQRQRGFRHWISTEGVSDYSRFLIDRGYSPDQVSGAFSERAVSNLPLEVSKPTFLQEQACAFLRNHRDEPFVLFVSFVEPHSPYNGPLNNEHSIEEIDLDPTAPGPATDDIPLRYRLMREWQREQATLDRKRLPMLYFFGASPEDYRTMKQRYFGLVTMVDRSIGAILECLEQTGLTEHTITVHTSDHGDMLGSHQLFGKEVMFEEAVRVPYLIRMPSQRNARTIDQPVSHIDFLPTLLDLLQQPNPIQCAGRSRLPVLRGEPMPAESVFLEWSPNRAKIVKGTRLARRWTIRRATKESTRAVVLPDGWKLCLRDKDRNELYDLKRDPIESQNLYYTSNHREVIARGHREIRRWQESVDDRVKV